MDNKMINAFSGVIRMAGAITATQSYAMHTFPQGTISGSAAGNIPPAVSVFSSSSPQAESSTLSTPLQGSSSTPSPPGNGGVQDRTGNGSNGATASTDRSTGEKNDQYAEKGVDEQPLSNSDKLYLLKLRRIDSSVRAHERAHLSAAGGLAVSGAKFKYVHGADGRDYAVAGEVSIDTSSERTPEATAAKMSRVRAAALAPADPSPQDRSVAGHAARIMVQAHMEIRENRNAEALEKKPAEPEEVKNTENKANKEDKEDKEKVEEDNKPVGEDKEPVEEFRKKEPQKMILPDLTFPWAEAQATYKAISMTDGLATSAAAGLHITV